jgi:hypothetical protein
VTALGINKRKNQMNLELILFGLMALLGGFIGVTIESRKSRKAKNVEGWHYTKSKFVLSSLALAVVGLILIIAGLFDME